MSTRPFVSRPHFYERTLEDSEGLSVAPAQLTRPDNGTETGVALLAHGRPRLILTWDAAWEMTEALASVLDHMAGDHEPETAQ